MSVQNRIGIRASASTCTLAGTPLGGSLAVIQPRKSQPLMLLLANAPFNANNHIPQAGSVLGGRVCLSEAHKDLTKSGGSRPMASLHELPDPLICRVLGFLPSKDVVTCRGVSGSMLKTAFTSETPYVLLSSECLRMRGGRQALEGMVTKAQDLQAEQSVRPAFTGLIRTGLPFRDLSTKLQQNRDVLIAALHARNQEAICIACENFNDDKEVMLLAVAQRGSALEYASDELKADKEVVLAAVAKHGFTLEHASAALKADKEVVLAAVGQHGMTLQYASEALRADREVVLAAVAQDGWALQYASPPLKADKEVVLVAAAKNGGARGYASIALRYDQEVLQVARSANIYRLIRDSAVL